MRTRPLALALAAALAACAHAPDLPVRPDPAPPAGSTVEEVVARDGLRLLARAWLPAGEPRAAVVIMHGLKDDSSRYAHLAARLAEAGFAVYAFDLRGHARSAGPRVAPAAWTDYVDDLDRFVTSVEGRQPGKPVFVFGHSMGGAIATRVAERHQPRLAGLALSGPALIVDAPPLLVAATRLAGALAPGAPALDLDEHAFSSDPAVGAAMARDPLVSHPPAPARTAAGLVEGMRASWADVGRLTMPLLALHGTADRLTAPAGSRALIDAAPAADRTLRIYEGYAHDLLHEPDERGPRVEDDLVAWLLAHAGGPALAAPARHPGPLAGAPRGWTQAVEATGGVARAAGGDLRAGGALALALARPRPLGWHGVLAARRDAAGWAAALRPIGLGVRVGGAALGVSGGAALVSGLHPAGAVGATLELPAGPLHLGLRAEGERRLGGDGARRGWLAGTLRLGGDRAYWPGARAGVGPALTAGWACAAGACGLVVLAGLQLYGAD